MCFTSASQPLTPEPPEEPFASVFAPQALPDTSGKTQGSQFLLPRAGSSTPGQTPIESCCWRLPGFYHPHHQPFRGYLLTVKFNAGCIFFTRVCTSWDYFNSIQETQTQTKTQMVRNPSDESFLILIFQAVLNKIFSTHN